MSSIDASTPGGRIKNARLRAGLTQPELAKAIGMSQSVISDAENQNPPKMLATTLDAICRRLGITAEYVMRGGASASGELEAEAAYLLRSASPDARDTAMRALRAMLQVPGDSPSGKQRAA